MGKSYKILALLIVFILMGCNNVAKSSSLETEAYYSIVNYENSDYFVLYVQSKSISSFSNINIDNTQYDDYFSEIDNDNNAGLDNLQFTELQMTWNHTIYKSTVKLNMDLNDIKNELKEIDFTCDDIKTNTHYHMQANYVSMHVDP